MVYDNISCGGSLIYLAGEAHATSADCRSPQVVWKNTLHIPACFAVIPAQAGIQTSDFQKYSTITAVWALPTDAVCRNIGCGRSLYILAGEAHATAADCRYPQVVWKNSPYPCQLHRHSRAGGNPVLWFSEIFNDYRSVGFARGCSLQKCQLRQVSIDSRRQSPCYGSHFQVPPSRLKKHPISLYATPSFPRRRESRPLIFRNIQRLPQYGLYPRMRFAEILASAGRLCFTGETRHIFRRRFYSN